MFWHPPLFDFRIFILCSRRIMFLFVYSTIFKVFIKTSSCKIFYIYSVVLLIAFSVFFMTLFTSIDSSLFSLQK